MIIVILTTVTVFASLHKKKKISAAYGVSCLVYDLISVIYYVDIKDCTFSSIFLSSHVYLQPADWIEKKILDSREDLRPLWKLYETARQPVVGSDA